MEKIRLKVVFVVLALCDFALVLLALIILNIISIDKINKKIQRLDEEIRTADDRFNAAEKRYQEDKQKAEQDSRVEPPTRREGIIELEKKYDELRLEVQEMRREGDGLREQKRQQEVVTQCITSGNLDVTEYFNSWAKNPSDPLPHETFYYIEGEMKIRVKREIKESAAETKWISNHKGIKKYLFPNPNSFNQMTDIRELYKMDQAKLKGMRQNKIRIVTPCEMTKDGFVEFPGELELL